MKKTSPIVQVIFGSLLLTLLFSINIFAQDVLRQDEPRKVRYITSAKNTSRVNKPRIRIVKRGSISRTPSKSVVNIKPTDFDLEKKAFNLINQKRVEKGLNKVVWNDKIAKLAREHSENMGKYSFFSHVGLNGRMIDQRAIDLGINNWSAIGENIAYNQGFEKPAEFAIERWMLSKTHRNNLLDGRWTDSGIGLCITEDGKYLFTQIFFVK